MKHILRFFTLIILFIFLDLSAFAHSHQEDDLGLWINNNVALPITEKVHTRFQISPRFLDNVTDISQFILHSVIGYKVSDNFSVWQGHAWNNTYIPGIRREQRMYQEFIYQKRFSKLRLENRVRLDERFLQNSGSTTFRPRYRLKAYFPLSKSLDLVAFDEIFLNLTSSSDGPQRGIDQNRIFIGLAKDISSNVSVEGGYQLQHVNSPTPSLDKFNHFILFNFNVILPQLIK